MDYDIKELACTIKETYQTALLDILHDLQKDCGPLFLIDDLELEFSQEKVLTYDGKEKSTNSLLKVLQHIHESDPFFYLKKNYFITGSKGMTETGPYCFSSSGTVNFFKEYAQDSITKIEGVGDIKELFSKDKILCFFPGDKSKIDFTGWMTLKTQTLKFTNDKDVEAIVILNEDSVILKYSHHEPLTTTLDVRTKNVPASSLDVLVDELKKQPLRELKKIVSREGENRVKLVTFTPQLRLYIVEKIMREQEMLTAIKIY